MSSVWEKFEIASTKYLNERFGEYASFTRKGGSDSTTSDIKVTTKSNRVFYMEAKNSPAQCGQFVLLFDETSNTFVYSPRNINPINVYAEQIIKHMNDNVDKFREPGTKGVEIVMNNGSDIFVDWIIEMYKNKKVLFIITNDFTILPIEDFGDYFDVSSTYRVKRSGSSNVGKNNIANVKKHISLFDYSIGDIREDGSKLFVESNKQLDKERFLFRGREYMFSLRDSEYEIRKLSDTHNSNVIFSINTIDTKKGIETNEFIRALK